MILAGCVTCRGPCHEHNRVFLQELEPHAGCDVVQELAQRRVLVQVGLRDPEHESGCAQERHHVDGGRQVRNPLRDQVRAHALVRLVVPVHVPQGLRVDVRGRDGELVSLP